MAAEDWWSGRLGSLLGWSDPTALSEAVAPVHEETVKSWRQKNPGLIRQKMLLLVTSGLDFRTGFRALPVRIWA